MKKQTKRQTPTEIVSAQRVRAAAQIAGDMEALGPAWADAYLPSLSPENPVNGRKYRGGNRIHLACAARARSFADNRWATFNQIREAGWRVKKGSKAAIIERWKEVLGHYSRAIGYWNVFNASEIVGIGDFEEVPRGEDYASRMSNLLLAAASDVGSGLGESEACALPDQAAFDSDEGFLCGLAREMARAAVHADTEDSSDTTAERLASELAGLFLLSSLGISQLSGDGRDDAEESARWMSQTILSDPELLFRAAARADKAATRILEHLPVACDSDRIVL